MGTIRVVRALTKTVVMAVSHLTVVMVVMAVLHLMVVMEVMAVSHLTVVMEVMAVSHLTVAKEVMAVSHLMVVMEDLDHHIKANGAHATTPGKKMIPMVDKANSFLTAHVVTNLTNIVAMMAITGLAVLQAVV